jgi:hypothetical protein
LPQTVNLIAEKAGKARDSPLYMRRDKRVTDCHSGKGAVGEFEQEE